MDLNLFAVKQSYSLSYVLRFFNHQRISGVKEDFPATALMVSLTKADDHFASDLYLTLICVSFK